MKTTAGATRVRVLPHPQLCPQGLAFEARPGRKLVDELLAHGIVIEHACEKVLGKHSGTHAVLDAYARRGLDLDAAQARALLARIRMHVAAAKQPPAEADLLRFLLEAQVDPACFPRT